MELELIEQDDNPSAAKAFTRLAREVAMMRLVVEKLTDEPSKIEIPDYTETLAHIADYQKAIWKGLKSLSTRPALDVTPEVLAIQIAAAGAEARRIERGAFVQATANLTRATNDFTARSELVRTADKQKQWLIWVGVACFVLGVGVAILTFRA